MSLRPLEDALADLLSDVTCVEGTQILPLRRAAGRVLASNVVAQRTQPDFDASAMDGYALRTADLETEASLLQIGVSRAGEAFAGHVQTGECVRIFTGAPVPEGADTVLIQENAEAGEAGMIRVSEKPRLGANIRRKGNDFSQGQLLLPAGSVLTAGMLALAASGGHPVLTVRCRPLVAVLATGDELVEPGTAVGPAQIVASNGYGVAAIVEANGGEILDLGIAPDDLDAIGERIDRASDAGADILVSIGGASVGDHDLAAAAFRSKGVSLDFWKVAMRPGKPIMAGRLDAMRVIGLPGNPASSMVAATVFLRPLLRRMAGLADETLLHPGRLGADVPANDHRAEFVRSVLRCDRTRSLPEIVPLDRQDSSLLSIYAAAQVLLLRPANAPPGRAGEPATYLTLD